MKKLKRLLIILLSFLPAACHVKFTGPLLWGHHTSAAFDAMVGIGLLDAMLIVWIVLVTWEAA